MNFFLIIFGHLLGDYLFQSKEMAIKKSEHTISGFFWCVLHCVIYTLCILLMIQKINPLIIILVFLSHYPIDRYSLAKYWLKLIQGRDIENAYLSTKKYHEIDLIFSCIVYLIVDNTLHLLLLWCIFNSIY